MKREETEKAFKALERQKKQYARQNEYIKNAFDRVSVALPKGTKERIQETGESINAFVIRAVLEALERAENEK